MKRTSSPIQNDDENMKKLKSAEEESDECEKLPNEIPTNQMDRLMDTRNSTDAENSVILSARTPPILLKISKNVEADLQLIQENFGELIRRRKAEKVIKLFTDTDDIRQDLISFLKANNFKYIAPTMFNVVIIGLPCDMRSELIEKALSEKDLDVEEVFQMIEDGTEKLLPLFQVVLLNYGRNQNIFNLTDLLNFEISVRKIRRSKLLVIKCDVKNTHEKCTTKSEVDVPKLANCGGIDEESSWHGSKKINEVSMNSFRKTKATDAKMTGTSDVNERETSDVNEMETSDVNGMETFDVNMTGTSDVNKPGKVASGNEGKKCHKDSKNNFKQPKTTDTKLYHRIQKNYQDLPNNNMDESESGSHLQDIIYIMQEFRKIFGKFTDPKAFAQKLKNANSFEKFEMFSAVFLD